VEGQYFLFDCGRGVSQRLWQKKIPLGKVNRLFLTHLHSDHIVGIPDFWLTGWLPANFGKRSASLQVWGPAGTSQMMESLQKAYDWDIKTRLGENNKPDSGIVVLAQDIKAGVVYEKGGIKVTAFKVDHADFIDSALGYRLDYAGRSVVISGDTRYSENLIKFAKDTDVLIHEVAVARPELIQKSEIARQILSYHTSPEDAGKVFAKVNPKMAVYYHITMTSTDPNIPAPTIQDIIPRTRVYFKGPLEVGEDLMTIEISDKVVVKRFEDDKK
jgi:ribonuclease Z